MSRLLPISIALFSAIAATSGPQAAAQSCSYNVDQKAANAGKALFIRCVACHEMGRGQSRRIGPNLGTMFDGKPLPAQKYNYSAAFRKSAPDWTDYKTLDGFLKRPAAVVPGTKMVFAGLPNPQDRKNLIAYLRSETSKSSCK